MPKRRSAKKASPKKKAKAPTLVGMRALARHLGVHLNAVQTAIQDGRIADAVVEKASGRGRPWKIDLKKAQALWERNTDPSRRPVDELEAREKHQADSGHPAGSVLSDSEQEDLPFGEEYKGARARRESAQARIKEMEAERMAETLLDRATTLGAVQAAFQLVRERIMAYAKSSSDELAALDTPAEVERAQYIALERVLLEAADSLAELAGDSGGGRDGVAA